MAEIGPHLLGRIPSPPDDRDYQLENFLFQAPRRTVDPPTVAASVRDHLKKTTVSYTKWASTVYNDVTTTHWYKAFDGLNQIIGVTPPPPGNVEWHDPDAVLDQGDQGTCVGHGVAQWGNTDPVNDHYTHTDAQHLYYEATVLDGSPDDPFVPGGGQQGATVRSGMKALYNRKRLNTYAVTYTVDSVRQWLQTKGPVVFGTDWENDMFYPDSNGYIKPTGGYAGGHCYLAVGDLASENAIKFLNSWGSGWGLGGYFKMKTADVQTLLNAQGEAWTAVEL